MDDVTRPSLLERVRDGADDAAWREFDACYGGLIVSYARRCGLQLSDAEDIRQQVLLGLSRALPGFVYSPEQGRFRTYVGRAVRHAVFRQFRRHRDTAHPLSHGALERGAATHAEPDDVWEEEWRQHHCRRALRALRETGREDHVEVFEALLAGDGVAAIAQRFGLSDAAVRKIKQRMKERLQETIAQQLRDEHSHA